MFLSMAGLLLKMRALFTVVDIFNKNALYSRVELLIFIQIFQTFLEFYSYLMNPQFWFSDYGIRIYYLTTFISIMLIPRIIYELARSSIPKKIDQIILIASIVVFILLFFSNMIVAGVGHTGITLTKVAGPLYWVFQLSVLASVILTLWILFKAKKRSTNLTYLKFNNLILTFLLYSGYFVFIIFIMLFLNSINAAGVLPIFTSIFLLCLARSLRTDKTIDLSYWIPFSKRRRLINRLVKPLITVCEDGASIQTETEYDDIVRQHALDLFKGDQAKAAHWLESYRPSLYSD